MRKDKDKDKVSKSSTNIIRYAMHVHSEKILDTLLKNTLKRHIPYLIGGAITGTFISYYYGFLFSILVNTIIWFVLSTTVNKYYWHYTGFRAERSLISIYLLPRKDTKTKSII
ncbi:MAG TPA: hypothetical protein VFV86_00605 [Nitrososphaeraceae archaeon]|nr:hypothetical protein [Nitrososphaeraceae archaeon]